MRDKPFLKQCKILLKNPLEVVRLQMEFIVATPYRSISRYNWAQQRGVARPGRLDGVTPPWKNERTSLYHKSDVSEIIT